MFIVLNSMVLQAGDRFSRIPQQGARTGNRWDRKTKIGSSSSQTSALPWSTGRPGVDKKAHLQSQKQRKVIIILAKAGPGQEKSELEAAREEFQERVNSAMQAINALFDKQKAIAIKRGNTRGAELIDRHRRRFKENRILPSVINTAHFEKEMVVAVTAMQKAYQKEIAECARNGDHAKASVLKAKAQNELAPCVFDGRRKYVRAGGGVFAIQPDLSWLEVKKGGDNHLRYYVEVARKKDYIELKNKTTDHRVRLYNDRVSLKHGYYPWRHFKNGRWAN
ncbi:MAG: hypothetical protein ACIAZJ_01350 [Gimesia chilikensis]|uniref:hypothetical protein n=1 Tax=Gimesia chilikensis TaxID=2605989 RepID=UPI003788849E